MSLFVTSEKTLGRGNPGILNTPGAAAKRLAALTASREVRHGGTVMVANRPLQQAALVDGDRPFGLGVHHPVQQPRPTNPAPSVEATTPPTGEDPFKRWRQLGRRLAEGFRIRFASTSENVAIKVQPAQPDSVDADNALAETAKRPAVAAAKDVEPVLDQNAEPTQVAASGQDATQRLTPDARTRHVRQQDPLSTPTQRFVGFNGTLYMPTAKQPMPGAQMIVGEPGDSALNNAPTTQHPISQPLAQPAAQPRKTGMSRFPFTRAIKREVIDFIAALRGN